jgi:hypothetical protein
MSIATDALGEAPIGADPAPATTTRKPPPNRRLTAKADVVQQPEPR